MIPTINSEPYDQSAGNLGCVDPHSKLDEGKCVCMPGYMDLGHGCRYEQPRAFVEQFWFAMNQSSYARRWDGKFLFPRSKIGKILYFELFLFHVEFFLEIQSNDKLFRINVHLDEDDRRRTRIMLMLEQTSKVLPKLIK